MGMNSSMSSNAVFELSEDERLNSADEDDVPAKTPEATTAICKRSSTTLPLTTEQHDAALGSSGSKQTYPCGSGTDVYRVCGSLYQAPTQAGDWLFVVLQVSANVPLADPANYYQYGFVFDADGDLTNNYQASAAYPNDYYQNTDRWYSVTYAPGTGWDLEVVDASSTKAPQYVYSAATALINGNIIMLVVPLSEFAVTNPTYRVTAFRHSGDYGQSPPFDWSGDYHPDIDQPLAAITPGP